MLDTFLDITIFLFAIILKVFKITFVQVDQVLLGQFLSIGLLNPKKAVFEVNGTLENGGVPFQLPFLLVDHGLGSFDLRSDLGGGWRYHQFSGAAMLASYPGCCELLVLFGIWK